MIKLLHTADWHLGARFRGLPPEKAAEKRQEQGRLLELLGELGRECDLALLAGDLLDRPDGEGAPLKALRDALEEMAVPVFIAPGNHDFINPESPYETMAWPSNVHIFKKPVPEFVELPGLSCRVWGAGYGSMDCPGLLEDFRAAGPEPVQLMVLHGDMVSAGSPCCPVTRAQAARSGLSYLALGHIHKAGSLLAGDTLCAWPGCPMGRGLDETGEKGAFLTELPEGKLRFQPLGLGRYEDLAVEVGEDPLTSVLEALPPDTRRDVYRITLTGPWEPVDTERLQEALAPRFFDLRLRDRTELPRELWREAGADSLEGVYFRLLRDAAETGEDREVLTLAARISRAILEGREVKLP